MEIKGILETPLPPLALDTEKGGSKGGKFGPALLGLGHPGSMLPSGRNWGRGGWVRGLFGMEVTPLHHGHTTSGTHGCPQAPRPLHTLAGSHHSCSGHQYNQEAESCSTYTPLLCSQQLGTWKSCKAIFFWHI